jgi:hypothetical protein
MARSRTASVRRYLDGDSPLGLARALLDPVGHAHQRQVQVAALQVALHHPEPEVEEGVPFEVAADGGVREVQLLLTHAVLLAGTLPGRVEETVIALDPKGTGTRAKILLRYETALLGRRIVPHYNCPTNMQELT